MPKVQIAIETVVEELHFLSRAQIQKISFLWRSFRSRARSDKFLKHMKIAYFARYFVIHFYCKFLCRKFKNTSMRHFSTPFEQLPFKELPKQELDE